MAKPTEAIASARPMPAEKRQRPFGAIEAYDRAQDAQTVAPSVELGGRAFRPRVIGRVDFRHRQPQFERVDGELGLDLEAARQHGERLHEAAREYAVARQHVLEARPEHAGDDRGEQPVAGAMAGAVGGVIAIDPVAHHHVEPLLEQARDHGRRARRVIGGIAVDQHVDVGLHVGEHAPHHEALTLVLLARKPRRRPRARRPRYCPSNCCRIRKSRPRAARRGSPCTTLATATSSL